MHSDYFVGSRSQQITVELMQVLVLVELIPVSNIKANRVNSSKDLGCLIIFYAPQISFL